MTAPHADQLIDGYMARLRAAAADLPQGAREELLTDMQSHIAEARSRGTDETDASILNILDRLGDPAVLTSETRDRLGLRQSAPTRVGLLEVGALLLLPFVWVAGVILLWLSPAWSNRDKVIGTIFSVGGYPFVLILGLYAAHTSAGLTTQPGLLDALGHLLEAFLPILLLLLPAATSVYLAIRLRRGQHQANAALA